MGGILSAWVTEIAILTYRGFKGKEAAPIKAPLPADYLGSVVIFGLLSLAARTQAETVAAVTGWGLVVATLLNLWTPTTPTKIVTGTKTKKKTTASTTLGKTLAKG